MLHELHEMLGDEDVREDARAEVPLHPHDGGAPAALRRQVSSLLRNAYIWAENYVQSRCITPTNRVILKITSSLHFLTIPFHRVMEMETVDLGLSPEGEALNNRSARDRTGVHQRTKPRQNFNPMFIPRTGTSTAGAEDGAGAAESIGDGGAKGDNVEGMDCADGVRGIGEAEVEVGTENGTKGTTAASGDRSNKRRRYAFKSGAEGTEEPAEREVEREEEEEGGQEKGQENPEGAASEVYRQGDMTDAQFLNLQNRIKNRPVSAVNGSYEMHIARPLGSMKGHTAFLTFAVCPLR